MSKTSLPVPPLKWLRVTVNPNDVFINCPFDESYDGFLYAICFTILYCGFVPRSALESTDAGIVRIEKINSIIEQSNFGIHDLSFTHLDPHNQLPRFNMPFELGLFLGCRRFGGKAHADKRTLIFVSQPYEYQQFISDIAGQDVHVHHGQPNHAVEELRDWLSNHDGTNPLPGHSRIWEAYQTFKRYAPLEKPTFRDYNYSVLEWLSHFR